MFWRYAAQFVNVHKEEMAMPSPTDTATQEFTSSAARTLIQRMHHTLFHDVVHVTPPPASVALADVRAAAAAIENKHMEKKALVGTAIGDMVGAGDGWQRPFQGADIYFGKATGAHEVHGDIRAKYDKLGGANGRLGLPTTDENKTPDNVGAFNHFQGGSIYWTPSTGPMMVAGTIRDVWAAQGWERGPLGYPVADEHRLAGLGPTDHPKVAWSLFENGAIVENAEGTHPALAAEIRPDQLRCLLRSFFDRKIHESPDNVGLQAPVETTAISGYAYGFWGSLPRIASFRLHGFRDNGLAPDTDFELDVNLRFDLAWPEDVTEPTVKTLIASLHGLTVTAHGVFPGTIAQDVLDGVRGGFFRGGPDPEHPEVPDGAVFITTLPTGVSQHGDGNIDVVDVVLTTQGGLQILVPPGPLLDGNLGTIRRVVADNTIASLLEAQGCG
jgi:LGFP repeat-containing protein